MSNRGRRGPRFLRLVLVLSVLDQFESIAVRCQVLLFVEILLLGLLVIVVLDGLQVSVILGLFVIVVVYWYCLVLGMMW